MGRTPGHGARACALTAERMPVFDDWRRWNGVKWKRGPVARVTHGLMESSTFAEASADRRPAGAERNRLY